MDKNGCAEAFGDKGKNVDTLIRLGKYIKKIFLMDLLNLIVRSDNETRMKSPQRKIPRKYCTCEGNLHT